MKTYKINWSRDDYGYILIKAESEDEARDMFYIGDFEDKDLFLKEGNMTAEDIQEVKEEA